MQIDDARGEIDLATSRTEEALALASLGRGIAGTSEAAEPTVPRSQPPPAATNGAGEDPRVNWDLFSGATAAAGNGDRRNVSVDATATRPRLESTDSAVRVRSRSLLVTHSPQRCEAWWQVAVRVER